MRQLQSCNTMHSSLPQQHTVQHSTQLNFIDEMVKTTSDIAVNKHKSSYNRTEQIQQ